MGHEHYEIYAIRYGHDGRRSSQNFLGGDPHDTDMPLDYFVWLIASPQRKIVLDTGYSQNPERNAAARPYARSMKASPRSDAITRRSLT